MKIRKLFKRVAVGLSVLNFAVYPAVCADTINQTGTSGATYTGNDDGVSSSSPVNPLRDIASATFANDANNLYITLNLNSSANLATGGDFNYIVGITTGNPSGGDTDANATTHGNAYGRAISFDNGFGGMTDFIGFYPAGGSGTTANPYTSFGFNDYVFGTPNDTTTTAGAWTKIETVASGEPISQQAGSSTYNSITLTVPMSDFAANLTLTPGTTIDFDIYSTGTSGNQTAYDSLANPGPTQTGTYNGTVQYNATILDQYTIAEVPEPTTLALVGLSGLFLKLFRGQRK